MTNIQIISRVRSSLKLNSADVALTDRAILQELKSTAIKYIKQQTDKRKLWDSPNLFTPLRITLQEASLAETCDYSSECKISRSIYKLPKIAEGIFGLTTMGAYTIDKKRKFTEVSPSRYSNILRLNLRDKNIYYWFFNGYLYTSSPTLEVIILPAFLEEEPSQEFSMDCEESCEDCPKNPLLNEFHCPGYLEKDITDAVVLFYKKIYSTAVEDVTNNGLDETK